MAQLVIRTPEVAVLRKIVSDKMAREATVSVEYSAIEARILVHKETDE